MLERERKLYSFNLGLLERMLEDVSDEELGHQPIPKMNPLRWILGHLAITTDSCLQLLEADGVCPADWRAAFAPGTVPNAPGAPSPSKAELLSVLRAGHERVIAALDSVDEAVLAGPHKAPIELLQKVFPTRGDLLAQLISNHFAFHLGQVSAWRRATGRPPLF